VYLEKFDELDGWGQAIEVHRTDETVSFISLGEDGVAGGDEDDLDIVYRVTLGPQGAGEFVQGGREFEKRVQSRNSADSQVP
jgi:hypothetical protein